MRADLRHRDMAFIDKQQRIFGQIFEQGRRRFARQAPGEEAAVILDPGAAAGGRDHFQIEIGALFQPLASSNLPSASSSFSRSVSSNLIALDRLLHRRARRDIVAVGIDPDASPAPRPVLPVSGSNSLIASISSPKKLTRQAMSS
jgi:hypothetical protein